MEVNVALELLELSNTYNTDTLRKAYYRKCLQYHPDKNKEGAEMFKLCSEANQVLIKNLNIKQNKEDTNVSYSDIFNDFLGSIKEKYNLTNKDIFNTIQKIVHNCSSFSVELLDDLDEETLTELYEMLVKWKHIFHIDNVLLDKISLLIQERYKKNDVYVVEPTIDDLMEHNVYKLMIEGNPYYVPLWHNELYFNNNIAVYIKPNIDENIQIDDNNNIILIKKYLIQNILYTDYIYVSVGKQSFKIPTNHLHIKPIQQYKFSKCGIPKINTTNVFDNKNVSDIIVYIILSNGLEK